MSGTGFTIQRSAIEGIEAVSADTEHAFGRHIHDQFGIGVILRGAQTSTSGRGMVEAEAGDIITVNPGEVHDGTPLGDGGRAWRMLYFDPSVLASVMRALSEDRIGCVEFSRPTLRDSRSATLFLSLFSSLTHPAGGYSELEGEESLLLLLASLTERAKSATGHVASRPVARARERIDDDPASVSSLSELSAISGLTKFQLVRDFGKLNGISPHAYLVQRRLQHARRLIALGTPLAEAALASGFSDQSHMTRHFVRAFGLTPGRFAAVRK